MLESGVRPEGEPAKGAAVGGVAAFKAGAQQAARRALDPVVRLLVWLGVTPDALTIAGFVISLFAAVAFFEGGFRLGALLLLLGGICDILDGGLARARQQVSKFGAFLDSTLDRLSEGAVLAGLAGFYLMHLLDLVHDPARVLEEVGRGLEPRTWALVALTSIVGLIGSYMVSYTRARAEGLGLDCRVGWFERPERLLLIMIAGFFGVGNVMSGALLLLTILSLATAAQRVVHVWRTTRRH